MLKYFFRYTGGAASGGFDVRKVTEFMGEPDMLEIGYRVYIDSGKSHWLSEKQLEDMLGLMESLSL
jgi:hypothetical protein